MTDRIRTTISLTPETLEIFKRMAEAGNMSVSRAMGEWLGDTADAAQMIVLKMEEAKKAPMRVMREMQSMIAGMSDQVDLDIGMIREKAAGGVRAAGRRSPSSAPAPSSNTGLKSLEKGKKGGKTCVCVNTKHERMENRSCPVHFSSKGNS